MCPELQRLDAMHFVRPTHDSTNRLCHEAVPTSRGRQHVPDVAAFPERDRHRSEIDVIPSGNRKGSLIRLPPGPIHGREKSARVLLPVRGRHLRHGTRNVGVPGTRTTIAGTSSRRGLGVRRRRSVRISNRADCRIACGRSNHGLWSAPAFWGACCKGRGCRSRRWTGHRERPLPFGSSLISLELDNGPSFGALSPRWRLSAIRPREPATDKRTSKRSLLSVALAAGEAYRASLTGSWRRGAPRFPCISNETRWARTRRATGCGAPRPIGRRCGWQRCAASPS